MSIAYNTAIIRDGLVLHYDAANVKCYPGTGTVFRDISGSGVDGTLTGGVGYSTANQGALTFDGSNDLVRFGADFTGLDLVDKTCQAWILRTAAGQKGLLDKDFDDGSRDVPNYGGWGFWLTASNKLWFWNHGNLDLIDDGPISFSNGVWTNVATTYNSATKTANFYINTQFNSSKTDKNIVELPSGTQAMTIGAIRDGTLPSFNFGGSIALVLAYNRVLTPSEIAYNYEATRGRFGV